MEKIGGTARTIEAEQKELATSSTRSQSETSTRTALPNHWVTEIFKRFQARYGNKWVSGIEQIEESAVEEWGRRLANLTGDEIKRGLDEWSERWPPSSEEFVSCCKGVAVNEFGLDYVPEYYRPKPAQENDPSKLLSSNDRDERREKTKLGLAALKEAIK